MINSALASSALSAQPSSVAATAGSAAESQDRFLKLLVTQMKNQDPLNPMDNAQVTSQMAQLSTVSGIDKLNATLQALSSSMIASQSMQAASMIGHVVMVPGKGMDLVNGKGMAALDLTQPADSVSVVITDNAGNVVRNMQMGSQSKGTVSFQWDGLNDAGQQLADGSYNFSATSQLGGVKSTASTMSFGLVNSVLQGTQGATLNVAGIGEVSMASIRQIL
jgi:flagellar basal-body rod modification protein FlgD